MRRTSDVLALAIAASGLVVALDQGSKALVTALIERGERVEVLPFLAFENVRNKGIAFGLGGDVSAVLVVVLVLVLVLLLALMVGRARKDTLLWLPAALLVGGALGNLADRVREEAVIDFIDLPLWPTFNLADVSIVVGVVLLLWQVEFTQRRRKPA